MTNQKNFILILVILIFVVLGFCLYLLYSLQSLKSQTASRENQSSQISPPSQPLRPAQGQKAPDLEKLQAKTEREIFIGAFASGFSPAGVSVKPNSKVTLTFINHDQRAHSLVSKELNINTGLIQPNQQTTVEFTLPDTPNQEYILQSLDSQGNPEEGYESVIAVGE